MARPSSLHWLLPLVVLGGSTVAVGCGAGAGVAGDVDNNFESDDPNGRTGGARGGAEDSASAGGSSSSGSSGTSGGLNGGEATPTTPGDAARTVEEADILKQDGNRLYTLSRYGGLSVVDISDPDHMKVLGRKRTEGIPFEMYVKGGRVFVMLNSFGRYVKAEGSAYGTWVESSEITELDVTNPAAISEAGHFDVPGSIADSRLVGDALYLVTYENGYCYGCGTKPTTNVTSFGIAGPAITKVDQLSYSGATDSSSWQRSVSATNERLYIAGPEWNWQPGQVDAHSIIQVVDITNPTGVLAKGADITVAGQINSRWQMDEYNGVLRVVSQHGNGWSTSNGQIDPDVQTFTIASSNSFVPLGHTKIIMPKPETLQSVRFDGTRGYAITSERRDPLFTLDLSNPALPVQAGQVELPGWIFYLEPKGDRLVGFGYADTTGGSGLAATLFDVADLTKPALLERVTFGAGWGNFAEDQDRIQKSVRVLDDQGLVLVPFASYGGWDGTNCSKSQSGIQLIDYSHDHLTLKGVAPQYGMPRRALIANNRLLAVSDRNVTSFDIASHDTPVKKGEIDLSNPAYRLAETPNHIASITNDWWTGEVQFSLTPKASPDDAAVTAKLSLSSLATPDQSYCGSNGSGAWASWYDARLFANGNTVYVSVPVYSYSSTSHGGKVVVAAIDITNPAAPVLAGKTELALATHDNNSYYGYYGGGWYDGYAYWAYYGGSLLGSGEAMVQLGSKLAYLESDYVSSGYDSTTGQAIDPKVNRRLHVVDFASPTAPVVSPAITLGDSLGTSPLILSNGVVHTSRWVRSTANPKKVRFFADRVDLSGPSPSVMPSLNIPGSLLLVDPVSNRYVTADYTASHRTAVDYMDCQSANNWRGIYDDSTHDCVTISRNFKLADVAGSVVTLRNTFEPPSQNIGGVEVADDRLYVTRYARYDYSSSYDPSTGAYTEPALLEQGGLWALGGIREGTLAIKSQMDGDAQWPLAVSGTKVAIYTTGGLAVYDTATPTPALLKESTLRGWGYSSHVLLGGNRAVASLGEFGMQTIDW